MTVESLAKAHGWDSSMGTPEDFIDTAFRALDHLRHKLKEFEAAPEKGFVSLSALKPLADDLAWSREVTHENVTALLAEALKVMRGPHADYTDVWRQRAYKAEAELAKLIAKP